MAAATDLVAFPAPAIDWHDDRPLATVVPLFAPDDAPSLRLTRRGRRVIAAVVLALAGALLWLAARSAPSPAATGRAPATVTVQTGDTLWSIAARVAPQTDPRAEVDTLLRLNHLGGPALVPGQVLRTR